MKLSLIIAATILSSFKLINGLHDYTIITGDGSFYSLDELLGRKVLMVMLPVTNTVEDVSFLERIDSINNVYSEQLTVVAVPSIESGYTTDSLSNLQQFYRQHLDSAIIITEGMYTRKSSGEQQSPLFGWLTKAEQNLHFDEDEQGPGQMFFINERGELYGVFLPALKWSDTVLEQMLYDTN